MKTSTARTLLRLNRRFYDTFASEFSDSRSTLQPGIVEALNHLRPFDSLLDVGCGDGRVGRTVQDSIQRYVGVDYSANLLAQSNQPTGQPTNLAFLIADLSSSNWVREVTARFDAAVCFSTLHHIPGARRRRRVLREIRSLLRPHGRCAVSVWQFLHVPRLRRKIVSWIEIGLSDDEVDAGDYLLDWQRGGRGLRYVHHFDEAELIALCERAGFNVIDTYRSDGHASGSGDMGLYVILQ